ncbi:MAG: RimK family alpha-L-glutamate ligase [Pseudomonadota bacterium]|nr:RimK family alpha-L-glutamate ligase [Pseudomonadota bacterium]
MEEAYAARGARVARVNLAACHFATASPTGLELPGFAALPDAAHVRTLAAGSFEAVTRRLGVLHALARLGVPVINDARAIEACVDKSTTSFLIARAGLPTPETWTLESREQARALARREIERGPLVLKPLFGAQGKGLRLIAAVDDLPGPEAVAGVYYLQRFEPVAGDDFRDFRFFVSGGRVVAAMMRRAKTWITNVKQGGEPFAVARDAELEALALAAARAVGAQIAGVDLIVGRDGPRVLEVNSMPAWSGLQKVTATDIAGEIAADVLRRIAR